MKLKIEVTKITTNVFTNDETNDYKMAVRVSFDWHNRSPEVGCYVEFSGQTGTANSIKLESGLISSESGVSWDDVYKSFRADLRSDRPGVKCTDDTLGGHVLAAALSAKQNAKAIAGMIDSGAMAVEDILKMNGARMERLVNDLQ